MAKVLLFLLVIMWGTCSFAEIVYLDNVKINEVSVYDDWEGGTILVGTSSFHSECPKGGYLNPEAEGFQHLYSIALAAGAAQNDVRIQLYSDRKLGDRCEIDAIRVFY